MAKTFVALTFRYVAFRRCRTEQRNLKVRSPLTELTSPSEILGPRRNEQAGHHAAQSGSRSPSAIQNETAGAASSDAHEGMGIDPEQRAAREYRR